MNGSLAGAFGPLEPSTVTATCSSDIWNVTIAQIAPIVPYLLLVLILIVPPDGPYGDARHHDAAATDRDTAPAGPTGCKFYGVWIDRHRWRCWCCRWCSRSGGSLTTFSLIGIAIIFALSYNILLGQTGMLSFGHAVYYGLGGFARHATPSMQSSPRTSWRSRCR